MARIVIVDTFQLFVSRIKPRQTTTLHALTRTNAITKSEGQKIMYSGQKTQRPAKGTDPPISVILFHKLVE